MAKATYHQVTGTSVQLDIVKTNKDGTVDLGKGKEVVVASCPVSDTAKPGHATLAKAASGAASGALTKAERLAAAAELREAATQAAELAAASPEDALLQAQAEEAAATAAAAEAAAGK